VRDFAWTKKWNLASSPADYKHSSALFYMEGRHYTYEVTNVEAMQDVNLHSDAGL
jgi:hypothetical protein